MKHRTAAAATLAALLVVVLGTALTDTAAVADDVVAENSVHPIDWGDFPNAAPTGPSADRARLILTNANEYALTTWWTAKYGSQGAVAYLALGGTDEPSIRPPATEALALAVALKTGSYDAAATGTTAAVAQTRALTLVRSVAKAHRVTTTGGWGRDCSTQGVWQSTLWAAQAGLAGWLLWGDLAAVDQGYVKAMVECEANSLLAYTVPYYRNAAGTIVYPGDSKAEENTWNARVLSLATAMMPEHTNWNRWQQKNLELLVSAFSVPSDTTSTTVVNGRTVADWVDGSNINADGTLVNHSRVFPDYMSTVTTNWYPYLHGALAGQPAPTAARWHGDLVYDAMVDVPFATPPYNAPGGAIYRSDGTIYYPQGSDWGLFRKEPFVILDVMAGVLGFDGLASVPAGTWEPLHSAAQIALQNRSTDGRTYVAATEDTYAGREELVAELAGLTYLTRWLHAQAAFHTSNDPYPVNGGVVVDNTSAGFSVPSGTWVTSAPAQGDQYLADERYHLAGTGTARARFTPSIPTAGSYRVYAWWSDYANHATNTPYTVKPAGSSAVVVRRDQRVTGDQWVYLGTYAMAAGTGSYVEVSDDANGVVIADAVRFDPVP